MNNTAALTVIKQYALPFFILMAIVLRLGTFFPSVINHDESTYIIIGNGLLHGQTYLVDTFDTKPIGIFIIYAIMNFLGGGSIFAMRLFTAATIGLTAFLLYRLGNKATGQSSVGLAAGVMYIFLTSVFTFYGISPNTELFFVPFAIAAINISWGEDRYWWHFLIAGLLLGFGFIIKYVIAADALALGLILLWIAWQKQELLRTIFQYCIPLVVGFFIPFALICLYYYDIGQIDNFLFYTFEVTSKYPVDATWIKRLLFVLDFFGRFFIFTIFAVLAWRKNRFVQPNWHTFLFLWLLCVTTITLLPGKIFGHYQIQLMPILALMAGSWFYKEKDSSTAQQWWSKNGLLTTTILWLGLTIGLFSYYTSKPDYPRQIATILSERMEEGDQVYTGNYHHIVNYLLEQNPLTPYVHSSLLFYEHHTNALNIDLEKEAKLIVEEYQPLFILLRKEHPDNKLTEYIYKHYQITQELPDDTWLFEMKVE